MKKALLSLIFATFALCSFAQSDTTQEPVVFKKDKLVSFNGKPITADEYLVLSEKNCSQAYKWFHRGDILKKTGTGLMAGGFPLAAAGCVMFAAGYAYLLPTPITKDAYSASLLLGFGATFIIVGAMAGIAGIPLYCVGVNQKKRSYEVYNNGLCEPQTAHSKRIMDIQFNTNGIALNF